jgi:hypothetical protein
MRKGAPPPVELVALAHRETQLTAAVAKLELDRARMKSPLACNPG